MSFRKQVSRGAEKYKQFIGNKAEGQGFADKRKRKIRHEYLKTLSKQRKAEEYRTRQTEKCSDKKYCGDDNKLKYTKHVQHFSKHHSSNTHRPDDKDLGQQPHSKKPRLEHAKKLSKFAKSQKQFSIRDSKRKRKKENALKKKEEKKNAIENYVNKKQEKHKKICKRTYKGQPVMKTQMELLLQRIEKDADDVDET